MQLGEQLESLASQQGLWWGHGGQGQDQGSAAVAGVSRKENMLRQANCSP